MTMHSSINLNKIVDELADLLVIFRRDFTIIHANKTYCEAFGETPNDIAGKSFLQFIHKNDLNKLKASLQKVSSQPYWYGHKHWAKTRNGIKYYEWSVKGIKDEDGTIRELVAVGRDITARKEMEKALKTSEKKYRDIFEQLNEGYVIIELNGVFRTANPAAAKILGFSSAEEMMHFKNFKKLYQSNDQRKKLINRLLKKGYISEHEDKYKNKDGADIYLKGSISTHLEKTTHKLIISILFSDITQRKIAEEKIRTYQEQLSNFNMHLQNMLENDRKEIAREVHDELGQSFTAINMALNLIKKLTPIQSPLHNKLASIQEITSQGIETIKRISTSLRPGILDDLGLVPAIEWLLKDFKLRTGIEYVSQIDQNIILTDKQGTHIFRIVQEALTNCSRHAHANILKLSFSRQDDGFLLRISDNGKGIPKKISDNPLSFGLIGINERVRLLNGKFEIHGMKNIGTILLIYIPSAL